MKKILILLLTCASGIVFGAAEQKESPAFTPADVIITAIINNAHNPVSVMNAQVKKPDGKLRSATFTIPRGQSTVDSNVCKHKLYTVLPYVQEEPSDGSNVLKKFHMNAGNGLYIFLNSALQVAACRLSRDASGQGEPKGLLAPWSDVREVELVIEHGGKLKMRVPGSLTKDAKSKKSKIVLKQREICKKAKE